MSLRLILWLLLGLLPGWLQAAETEPIPVAVFDFELIDSSLEGAMMGRSPQETERLARLGDQLRGALNASPEYVTVETPEILAEARRRNLQSCGGCDRKLAAKAGASRSVTGTVQKVSNLILNINVYVRDVESGEMVKAASADIRGNTDQSWRRGLDWMLRNRLLTAR